MKLKRSLSRNRSYEQIKNHYLVERSIAQRLKESSPEERKLIYSSMYEELFSKVPDHPRLTRRESNQLTYNANKAKYSMLFKHLNESDLCMEFGSGDCRFAFEVAKNVSYVYGIDISDQRNPNDRVPENFKLIVYDGYNLDEIESNSIDLIFSDQLIEHFHPEDTKLHFELVHRILKTGGRYVFRTPHFLTGPHDVSKYFSDEPECFHLKEWSYAEIKSMLTDLNFSKYNTYWNGAGLNLRIPFTYFAICENILGKIPRRFARVVANYIFPSLCGVAIK